MAKTNLNNQVNPVILLQPVLAPESLKKKIQTLEACACGVFTLAGLSWLLGIFGLCFFSLGLLPLLILINIIRQKRDLYHMSYGRSLEVQNSTVFLGLIGATVNAGCLIVGVIILSGV
jgi:hypothetical protein